MLIIRSRSVFSSRQHTRTCLCQFVVISAWSLFVRSCWRHFTPCIMCWCAVKKLVTHSRRMVSKTTYISFAFFFFKNPQTWLFTLFELLHSLHFLEHCLCTYVSTDGRINWSAATIQQIVCIPEHIQWQMMADMANSIGHLWAINFNISFHCRISTGSRPCLQDFYRSLLKPTRSTYIAEYCRKQLGREYSVKII